MRLAIYPFATLLRGAVIERSSYPGVFARSSARSHFAHAMSDEAVQHFASEPRPTFNERTGNVLATARSHTPFDVKVFR